MDGGWLQPDSADNTVILTVDERVYSVNALLRAAYWFTDRAFIFVSKPAEHTLRVHIKAKPPTLDIPSPPSASDVAGEFGNSLLDYQLRESIEERTGKIRDLLVTTALGEADLKRDLPPGSPNDSVANRDGADLARAKV